MKYTCGTVIEKPEQDLFGPKLYQFTYTEDGVLKTYPGTWKSVERTEEAMQWLVNFMNQGVKV